MVVDVEVVLVVAVVVEALVKQSISNFLLKIVNNSKCINIPFLYFLPSTHPVPANQ